MSKQVFIDFGSGYQDITSEVLYDDFSIRYTACSDNFHYSVNTTSFSVRYDSVIFPLIRDSAEPLRINIQEDSVDLFTGNIPVGRTYTYNGKLDNTIVGVEAEDDTLLLDKEVGDIAYENYKIMDDSNKTQSIIHQLAYLAGFNDSQIDSSVNIDVVMPVFVPPDPTNSILDLLDTLLFEYGWVLNFNQSGEISPLKWILDDNTYVATFDDTNIIREVQCQSSARKYDGAEVIYYELGSVGSNLPSGDVPIYRDSALPLDDASVFTGYIIPTGLTYPPQTNVIDTTTGDFQIVYQEYDSTAIQYWTNEAIVKGLDYNYKAFDSDYSDVLLTKNHRIEWRADTGVTIDLFEFKNRKARVVFKNTTGSPKNIYYFLIYAQVIYKTAERTSRIENIPDSKKIDKYVSTFIFDKAVADNLTQYLASMHSEDDYTYSFYSQEYIPPGSLVRLTLGEGTDRICYVNGVEWQERDRLWRYV